MQTKSQSSKILIIAMLLCFLRPIECIAQKESPEKPDQILLRAEIIAGNLQTAINVHLQADSNFHVNHQVPDEKINQPNILIKKDGSWEFDWTNGQHARLLMEELRQGIHALQSAEKPRGLDIIALTGAREYWPKLKEISCHESPGTRYYDLDGFEKYCPNK